MNDDGKRCGAMDSNNRRSCELDQGHGPKVMHKSDAFMWKDVIGVSSKRKDPAPKPKKSAPVKKSAPAKVAEPTEPQGCSASRNNVWHAPAMCSLPGGHDGDHTAEVVVSEDWPETGQARRIAWDKYGVGKGNDTIGEPAADPDPEEADQVDDLDMRNIARQQREEREAHADELASAAADVADVEVIEETGPLICGYPRHPAAALFELLEGEALTAIADSIQTNGLRESIVLVTVGGKTSILDGSNRATACELRGIKPRFVTYEGPKDIASLIQYSLDKNQHRRHQEPSVLAMIAVDAGMLMGRGNPGDRETGRSAGLMTQAEAGKKLGVSERLVRRAKVVREKGTAKVNEAVRKGRLALDAAIDLVKLPADKQDEYATEALEKKGNAVKSGRVRAMVRQEGKREVVRAINENVEPGPMGPFGVISIDPPWPYENSDQHEGSRGHISYPPMSIAQLCALRAELDARALPDCILAMWVTNAFIGEVGRILEAWGFTIRTMYSWDKELEGVGTWGRGRTEHLVIASRGEPVHTLNEVSTMLPPARRREHSRKPDEAYALLAAHCSGPMIDMFAREPREGWSTWGAETTKFAAEAA